MRGRTHKPRLDGLRSWALWAFAALLPCTSAWAQNTDQVRRLERQLRELDLTYRLQVPQNQPISERLLLDYGALARVSLYSIDDSFGTSRTLRQYDGRLYVRAELDGAHRFFGRLRFQFDDWNQGDSFDRQGDEWRRPIGEQYWYQFDYRGLKLATEGVRPDWNFNVKVGRQFVNWGAGLMLSNLMYAVVPDFEIANFGLTGIAAYSTDHDTIDFDGSRPDFDVENDRAFFGGKFEYRGFADHRPYVFGIMQEDHNSEEVVFTTPLALYPTAFRYHSNYIGVGSTGSFGPKLLYRTEVVYEFGEGLSNPFDPDTLAPVTQTMEDIEAWAAVAGLTYVFNDVHDTRVEVEMVAGSGDDDRFDSADTFGGNATGTTDESFNGWGYVNTGLALAPDIANLLALRATASMNPFPTTDLLEGLRLNISGFLFNKVDADAPVNVTTVDERFIGGEINGGFDWRLMSDVSWVVRYGIFLPGEAMPEGQDDPRHFFFTGITYAF